MSKVFVNIALSLDGCLAPEGMDMAHFRDPKNKTWGAKWGAPMAWALNQQYLNLGVVDELEIALAPVLFGAVYACTRTCASRCHNFALTESLRMQPQHTRGMFINKVGLTTGCQQIGGTRNMTQQNTELKVICEEDCGNAPRKAQLRDFNIALACVNIEEILNYLTDNIVWHMVGQRKIEGRQAVAEFLKQIEDFPACELKIDNILTHGTDCAATGQLTFPDGKVVDFGYFYIFAGHAKHKKIKLIKSFVVETKYSIS